MPVTWLPARLRAPLESGLALSNGWTGGQYSVYRVLLGTYLAVHFSGLIPWGRELFSNEGVLPKSASPVLLLFPNVLALWDGPLVVSLLLGAAVLASAVLALGWYDRVAAVFLWYVWACLFGRNPLISNPGLPYVGMLLLVHALLPRAPYGSVERAREADPGAGWRLSPSLFFVVWALMAVGYSYSGYTKCVSPSWLDGSAVPYVLQSPLARPGPLRDFFSSLPLGVLRVFTYGALALELLFAPLALFRRLRPWLWLALLGMHLGLIVLIDFADLSLGMVMLHLFTFDPAWVKPVPAGATERLFYDGNCGLCHRAIRFVLSEDGAGTAFRFAPLDSELFRKATSVEERATLPDSVVIRTADGRLLARSAAVRHLMLRLGGLWRVGAVVLGWLPRRALDTAYDGLASVRHRLFAKPEGACPVLPRELRARFDF